jgi:phosphoenolpyruvate synthase/pyruvate phosphate dikinase
MNVYILSMDMNALFPDKRVHIPIPSHTEPDDERINKNKKKDVQKRRAKRIIMIYPAAALLLAYRTSEYILYVQLV